MKKHVLGIALALAVSSFQVQAFIPELRTSNEREQRELIVELYNIGAVQSGFFTLASGLTSTLYVDLRLMMSYPILLQQAALLMSDTLRGCCQADVICGVPYGALPLATMMSIDDNTPMIMLRKERKSHGTKNLVEGAFRKGQTCVVVDDVMTTGASVLEAVHALEAAGLVVNDVVVLVDREQGGKKLIEDAGYRAHAVFTVSELLSVLSDEGIEVPIPIRKTK